MPFFESTWHISTTKTTWYLDRSATNSTMFGSKAAYFHVTPTLVPIFYHHNKTLVQIGFIQSWTYMVTQLEFFTHQSLTLVLCNTFNFRGCSLTSSLGQIRASIYGNKKKRLYNINKNNINKNIPCNIWFNSIVRIYGDRMSSF